MKMNLKKNIGFISFWNLLYFLLVLRKVKFLFQRSIFHRQKKEVDKNLKSYCGKLQCFIFIFEQHSHDWQRWSPLGCKLSIYPWKIKFEWTFKGKAMRKLFLSFN